MKFIRFLFIWIPLSFFIVLPAQAQSPWGDLVEEAQKRLGAGEQTADGTIIDGLKEALQIGTGNVVEAVSVVGGYYDNPKIKIPLPDALQRAERVIRMSGYGNQLDAFELSMNQAAEKAAPQAKQIFWDSIKEMSIADARKILDGPDDGATRYFKDRTYDRLSEIFKPIVHQSMSEVGVTEKYQELNERTAGLPLVGTTRFDLDTYVTEKALDGLFLLVAEEEKKIRRDPAARATDLLKEVFGNS